MLTLNSTIELDFKSLLRWWLGELSFLVPEKLKKLLSDKRGFIIVSPTEDLFTVSFYFNGQTECLGNFSKDETGVSQYKALLTRDERLVKTPVVLRLTGREVIQRELSLPVAAKENLQQVLSYELDRYTPFKAEQVYFALKSYKEAEGQIKVLLMLTPREVLNALYDDLKLLGMLPILVDYEGTANDLEKPYEGYNLLPEWLRTKTAKSSQLIFASLIGLVSLLAVSVLVMPVWWQYKTVEALKLKTQTLEKEAKKIKASQAEIDAVIAETAELIAEKTAKPQVLEVLNTLSTLTKDDTWLAYIQYADGHLQLQGESTTASGLIGVLETSAIFDNAVFVSPVTQDPVSKMERFQISVNVTSTGASHAQ